MAQTKSLESGRLDAVCALAFSLSRAQSKSLIASGQIRVNEVAITKASSWVNAGDTLSWPGSISVDPPAQKGTIPFDIRRYFLYEDQDLVVLNKPAGLTVHPGEKTKEWTLTELLTHAKLTLFADLQPTRPGIVHRLDKDTDGLMVLAKTQAAYAALVGQFQEKTIEKIYLAMVNGNVVNDHFRIDRPLIQSFQKGPHMRVAHASEAAKPAQTDVEVLHRYQTKTLLKAYPLTGRTHQIRVHLAAVGHPVIGDVLYGKPSAVNGQRLQAYALGFTHPQTGQRMRFCLPASTRLWT